MTTAEWAVLAWLVAPFAVLGLLALIAKLRRTRRQPCQVIRVDRWKRRVG